jgi:hypothetical protein
MTQKDVVNGDGHQLASQLFAAARAGGDEVPLDADSGAQ